MSDIFLSYKREDKPRAEIIAEALERQGYSVWWDPNIDHGDIFDEVIQNELDAAKCVLVLWSKKSVKSKWVRAEATSAGNRLVPALIEVVNIPVPFNLNQTANLIDWEGDLSHPEFSSLLGSVSKKLGRPLGITPVKGINVTQIDSIESGNSLDDVPIKSEKIRISGMVRNSKDGTPIADADIKLSIKNKEIGSIISDAYGVFLYYVENKYIGKYVSAYVEKEGFQPTSSIAIKIDKHGVSLECYLDEEEFRSSWHPEQVLKVKEKTPNTYINSIGMKFVLVPEGEFMMGSEEHKEEKPVHKVKISKPFYLGVYPVTQREWNEVMRNNPSHFKGDKLPIENVSWDDVQEFIEKLNEKENTNKYRLPSEAEWEYAARAATTTMHYFGDDNSVYSLHKHAWHDDNSDGKTHPVGEKMANARGLYDIYGNVWEWMQDNWHNNYIGAPIDGSAWEGGIYSHIVRGGSWKCPSSYIHSAHRTTVIPDGPYNDIGFRPLKDL